MNRDTHIIFESYKRGRKIQRINAVDATGKKVCFHVGDYVNVINSDVEGDKDKPRKIKGFEYNNLHWMQINQYNVILTDTIGSFQPNSLILSNEINQAKAKDRSNVVDILDI